MFKRNQNNLKQKPCVFFIPNGFGMELKYAYL